MICAELTHNPYLLTTDVLFNGRSPKINSAIEKFEGRPLVDWVKEVPRIFHDEMNGYDFDFIFNGTDSDFEKIQKAFRKQGISDKEVRLVHKSKFEDIETKRQRTDQLLDWLGENRNHRFDFESFMDRHADTLDNTIPYIVIQDEPATISLPYVEIESVKSVFDLSGTVLTSTPLLFTVSQRNRAAFRKELLYILNRPDVQRRQLFFIIHPSIDQERAVRTISDLGVRNPQVVESPSDDRIIEYLNDYPAIESIRNSIHILRKAVDSFNDAFAKVNKFREATNAGVRDEIQSLESEIESLKRVRSYLQSNETYLSRQRFGDSREQLENQIQAWRNRKSSITGSEQIRQAAHDYSSYLRTQVVEFEVNATSIMEMEATGIDDSLAKLYASVDSSSDFSPSISHPISPAHIALPNIEGHLCSLTETTLQSIRNDFFSLFSASSEPNREGTETEVASFEIWRKHTVQTVIPLAKAYIESCEKSLSEYYAALTEAYIRQIDQVIEKKLEAKARSASRLSLTEQGLQEDRDWITSFEEQLEAIERG